MIGNNTFIFIAFSIAALHQTKPFPLGAKGNDDDGGIFIVIVAIQQKTICGFC